MVTIKEVITIRNGKEVVEGACLSSDPKPLTFGNGSILMEMNTSKLFMFDETNNTWREWS